MLLPTVSNNVQVRDRLYAYGNRDIVGSGQYGRVYRGFSHNLVSIL